LNDDAPLDDGTCGHDTCDEAELIRSTLAGQTTAFGQLVLKYQDRLFNTLYRVLGSAEDARDVVQDAFVQAFLKLESFRGSAAFYTWLYRIAFNLAMSHRRRQRPTASLDFSKHEHGVEPVDGQPTPEAHAARRDRARLVQAALAELAADHREVIVLRELDGCRYDEIAEILALPIGTVRSRLFRARLELRDRLAPMLSGDEITNRRQNPDQQAAKSTKISS
jgi:RNA polymerase sigma-70 factor (ECF subfamily)